MPPRRRKDRFATELGLIVRRMREARNWSYTDLARRTNRSATYIRMLESGTNVTSIFTLQWLAYAFGMRSWELLRQVEETMAAADKAAEEQTKAQLASQSN
jgi:transcriptional regulator with XRE-family HTH domain